MDDDTEAGDDRTPPTPDPDAEPGYVAAIYLAPGEGEPMERAERVEAVADRGLRGDRYFRGTGYYSGFDGCQVTLVDAAVLADARDSFGVDLTGGRHRRNLVTRGVDVPSLVDERFRVGGVEFVGTRPRPPCAHLEDVADAEGAMAALREARGGVCADVVASGVVSAGDRVERLGSVTTDPDDLAAAIRERHD